MNRERIGSLIVWSGNKSNFSGIITERDILTAVADEQVAEKKVKDIMKEEGEVIKIEPAASLEAAADKMVDNSIKHLPVVSEGEILGIVTATDLISYEDKLVEKLSQVFLYSETDPSGGFAS